MALLFLLLVRVASSRPDLHNLPEVMSFADWKITFERKYADAEDEAFRARAFADNVKRIQHHNAHGSKSYRLGVNKFSDLTPEEFRTQYLQTSVMAAPARRNETDAWLNTTDLGSTIDWRTKGAVSPVKNQGMCGSCWAFSAVGAMEGAFQIATGELRQFAEQQLVACVSTKNTPRGKGCQGGLMTEAFEYVLANHGIDSETDYPYLGADAQCWQTASKRHAGSIDSFNTVPADSEAQLAAAVLAKGPVAVAIQANQSAFQNYKSGVFDGPCGVTVDHGVLVVGLTDDAYIVKNSWGSDYGEHGYIRMKRNIASKSGICGIATQASYPLKAKGTAPPLPPRTNGTEPGYDHLCGCKGPGQCAAFGMHCCCLTSEGDMSCQSDAVTKPSQCCKPPKGKKCGSSATEMFHF